MSSTHHTHTFAYSHVHVHSVGQWNTHTWPHLLVLKQTFVLAILLFCFCWNIILNIFHDKMLF